LHTKYLLNKVTSSFAKPERYILSFVMRIDDALITKLERLARLELGAEEKDTIKTDLNKILEMVNKLSELNTDNVEPLVYMNEVRNQLREDSVANELSIEEAMYNAPAKNEEGYFLVPKVLHK